MTPCAYFSNGNCIETMETHIMKGLEIIDALYLRRGYDRFLRRLLNIEPETAGDLLRKAYVLHDVGKCLEFFQERRGSFGYHEFYSYLIAKDALREFGTAGLVASAAILLHHHDWVRKRKPPKPSSLVLDSDCVWLIRKLSNLSIPKEMNWGDPVKEYLRVSDFLTKNLRAVYALLLPIVVADNYAAACNRGGAGSTLGKEILETLDVRRWDLAGCLSGGLR